MSMYIFISIDIQDSKVSYYNELQANHRQYANQDMPTRQGGIITNNQNTGTIYRTPVDGTYQLKMYRQQQLNDEQKSIGNNYIPVAKNQGYSVSPSGHLIMGSSGQFQGGQGGTMSSNTLDMRFPEEGVYSAHQQIASGASSQDTEVNMQRQGTNTIDNINLYLTNVIINMYFSASSGASPTCRVVS